MQYKVFVEQLLFDYLLFLDAVLYFMNGIVLECMLKTVSCLCLQSMQQTADCEMLNCICVVF